MRVSTYESAIAASAAPNANGDVHVSNMAAIGKLRYTKLRSDPMLLRN